MKIRRKLIFLAPVAILGVLLFIALGGEIVMQLWNWLLPPIFALREINFWQALGIPNVPTTYGDTFVRTHGPTAAPPLVLLPGATATSVMWAPNIETLSTEYHTFAIDQIGDFGKSICTKPVRPMNDLTTWLDAL